MRDKEDQIFDILDYTHTITEISCDGCRKMDAVTLDGLSAAECFYELGWRYKRNKLRCPKCSKRKVVKKSK